MLDISGIPAVGQRVSHYIDFCWLDRVIISVQVSVLVKIDDLNSGLSILIIRKSIIGQVPLQLSAINFFVSIQQLKYCAVFQVRHSVLDGIYRDGSGVQLVSEVFFADFCHFSAFQVYPVNIRRFKGQGGQMENLGSVFTIHTF